jgi:hypothetical protein
MTRPAARFQRFIRPSLGALLVVLLVCLAAQPASAAQVKASTGAAADALVGLNASPPGQVTTGGVEAATTAAAAIATAMATTTTVADDTQPTCDPTALPASNFGVASPGQTMRVLHDDAALDIGPDTMAELTTIEAASLCATSLAPLDPGMTNVTSGMRRGYRFLPHTTFKGNLKVTLPYDKTLIPLGLSEQDVKTFYFDDVAQRWLELERVSLDPKAGTVASMSDHFTDMINATVTVPDHPETLAYDPTSIKNLKAADPSASVNLIGPPQANSLGDARLSYPIEVPPGRGGQPALTLGYDSANGNGWVGLGWELAAPAVTIDTRWGVPRYDTASETETYTLGGEELTPVANRGPAQARTAEKVFHSRVEGRFRRIVRHGSSPSNYWWEITDKDGTRSFYGGDPDSRAPAADARLTDGRGNVFTWALRESRDLNGNGVRYAYDSASARAASRAHWPAPGRRYAAPGARRAWDGIYSR